MKDETYIAKVVTAMTNVNGMQVLKIPTARGGVSDGAVENKEERGKPRSAMTPTEMRPKNAAAFKIESWIWFNPRQFSVLKATVEWGGRTHSVSRKNLTRTMRPNKDLDVKHDDEKSNDSPENTRAAQPHGGLAEEVVKEGADAGARLGRKLARTHEEVDDDKESGHDVGSCKKR